MGKIAQHLGGRADATEVAGASPAVVKQNVPVAQGSEQWAFNSRVEGSNPSRFTS